MHFAFFVAQRFITVLKRKASASTERCRFGSICATLVYHISWFPLPVKFDSAWAALSIPYPMHGVASVARERCQKKGPRSNCSSSHEQGQRPSHKTGYHFQRLEPCRGLHFWKLVSLGHWTCFGERREPHAALPVPIAQVQTVHFGLTQFQVSVLSRTVAVPHNSRACPFVCQLAHRISGFDVFFLNGTVGHAAQLQCMGRKVQSMMVFWSNNLFSVCSNTNFLMHNLGLSPCANFFFSLQGR